MFDSDLNFYRSFPFQSAAYRFLCLSQPIRSIHSSQLLSLLESLRDYERGCDIGVVEIYTDSLIIRANLHDKVSFAMESGSSQRKVIVIKTRPRILFTIFMRVNKQFPSIYLIALKSSASRK